MTTETLIIGVSGKARSGKDVLATFLEAHALHYYVRRYAFADALKAYCRIHHGMRLKDPKLLQDVGSEFRLKRGEDVWVEALALRIDEDSPNIAFVTDVRYPNELAWIRAQGGLALRVRRLDAHGQEYISPDRDATHSSETALDFGADFDAYIEASSVAMLKQAAKDAWKKLVVPCLQRNGHLK